MLCYAMGLFLWQYWKQMKLLSETGQQFTDEI